MATIKRQRADGNWEYLQMTGEDLNTMKNDIVVHQSDYVKHQGFGITTGLDNNYSVTLFPPPNTYLDGMCIVIAVHSNSNGVCTLNINGLGSKKLKKPDGSDVVDLKQNCVYTFTFYDNAFVLQGEGMKQHGNEFHSESFMPVAGGNFTGPISINGKPVVVDNIDSDPADITYYVRSNGDDSNDGKKETTAFRTFDKAMSMWKTITTGGKRTFDIGAGVDLTNHREWKVENKFGGDFVFNFNNVHEIAPQFENLKCRVRVERFTRYDSGILGNQTYGEPCYANRCDFVDIDQMKVDRRGKNAGFYAVSFSRTRGRIGESEFLGTDNGIYVEDFSSVFLWMVKGQVKNSYGIPIRATLGGIVDAAIFNITGATVLFEESTGGRVFGIK